MTKEEKRDMYIAAAVGGVALILILLYVGTPEAVAQTASLPDATEAMTAGESNPYNYNIQPYGGSGSPLYVPPNGTVQPGGVRGGNYGGGCCDQCGTGTGSSYENPGVLAYLKLLALGA